MSTITNKKLKPMQWDDRRAFNGALYAGCPLLGTFCISAAYAPNYILYHGEKAQIRHGPSIEELQATAEQVRLQAIMDCLEEA